MKISITIPPYEEQPISGFIICDMTIAGKRGTISSSDDSCMSKMMAFVSLPLLLYDLQRFLSLRNMKTCNFIGIESSFKITFMKINDKTIQIQCMGELIDEITSSELYNYIIESVTNIIVTYYPVMNKEDGVIQDIIDSLKEFKTNCGS